jgi:hypothetical protein
MLGIECDLEGLKAPVALARPIAACGWGEYFENTSFGNQLRIRAGM